MSAHHRRNVNNPFANTSRRTVGYSDHRYGNPNHQQHRGRRSFLRSPMSCILIVVGSMFFLSVLPSSNYDNQSLFKEVNTEKEKTTEHQSSQKASKQVVTLIDPKLETTDGSPESSPDIDLNHYDQKDDKTKQSNYFANKYVVENDSSSDSHVSDDKNAMDEAYQHLQETNAENQKNADPIFKVSNESHPDTDPGHDEQKDDYEIKQNVASDEDHIDGDNQLINDAEENYEIDNDSGHILNNKINFFHKFEDLSNLDGNNAPFGVDKIKESEANEKPEDRGVHDEVDQENTSYEHLKKFVEVVIIEDEDLVDLGNETMLDEEEENEEQEEETNQVQSVNEKIEPEEVNNDNDAIVDSSEEDRKDHTAIDLLIPFAILDKNGKMRDKNLTNFISDTITGNDTLTKALDVSNTFIDSNITNGDIVPEGAEAETLLSIDKQSTAVNSSITTNTTAESLVSTSPSLNQTSPSTNSDSMSTTNNNAVIEESIRENTTIQNVTTRIDSSNTTDTTSPSSDVDSAAVGNVLGNGTITEAFSTNTTSKVTSEKESKKAEKPKSSTNTTVAETVSVNKTSTKTPVTNETKKDSKVTSENKSKLAEQPKSLSNTTEAEVVSVDETTTETPVTNEAKKDSKATSDEKPKKAMKPKSSSNTTVSEAVSVNETSTETPVTNEPYETKKDSKNTSEKKSKKAEKPKSSSNTSVAETVSVNETSTEIAVTNETKKYSKATSEEKPKKAEEPKSTSNSTVAETVSVNKTTTEALVTNESEIGNLRGSVKY